MPTVAPRSLPDTADLVVVGAGVSGLYTAWRYLQKNPDDDVVVIERLNRPGGRLQTDLVEVETDDGTVTIREEEGGMRFNYSMRELMSVFGALDLCDQIVPFPMQGSNNRYHFRGRTFTHQEAAENPGIWGELFDLAPEERNRAPTAILATVFRRVLRNNGLEEKPADPDPEWWQHMRLHFTWGGTPLYEWQLWGLMRDMGYSEGCCTMLAHALGFEGPFFSRMNAGEAFQLLEDFPADPTYFTFRKGFSTLVDALVSAVEQEGGSIFLSTNVDELQANGSGYDLSCMVAPDGQSSSPYVEGGRPERMHGDKVVLAVARKALEDLWQTSSVLNRRHGDDEAREAGHELWANLQAATDQQLLKINLYFPRAWWRTIDRPVAYGPSFSDLPVGSVYPFYALEPRMAQDDVTEPPPAHLPAALTIYCDWDNANFWRGLQESSTAFSSSLQKKYSTRDPQRIFPASEAVVEEALRLFSVLYSTPALDIPEPIMTSFRLWDGESDFGYAVHQWGLGAKDDAVMQALANPVGDIYTCGEAFSDMQGWVNGALRSADLALDAMDGIPPLRSEEDVHPCAAPGSAGARGDGAASVAADASVSA